MRQFKHRKKVPMSEPQKIDSNNNSVKVGNYIHYIRSD